MSAYQVEGPRGVRLVGQGSRTRNGRTYAGWIVYRPLDEGGAALEDPVFKTYAEALGHARGIVGA